MCVTWLRKVSHPMSSASKPGMAMSISRCRNRLSANTPSTGNSDDRTTPKICVPLASVISCAGGGLRRRSGFGSRSGRRAHTSGTCRRRIRQCPKPPYDPASGCRNSLRPRPSRWRSGTGRLDKAGRQRAGARRLGLYDDAAGKECRSCQEPEDRRIPAQERASHKICLDACDGPDVRRTPAGFALAAPPD